MQLSEISGGLLKGKMKMNELIVTINSGIETADSRQVAELIGKEHYNLVKDIRKYCGYLTDVNFDVSEFFLESTYNDATGRTLPCYLVTRKGCEMIANKLTGQKGVAFSAMYINAFHDMKHQIEQAKPEYTNRIENADFYDKIMFSKHCIEVAEMKSISPHLKQALIERTAQVLLDSETNSLHSTDEVAGMLGVLSGDIEWTAETRCMKVAENGSWIREFSDYYGKEIYVFYYNDNAVEKFRKFFKS